MQPEYGKPRENIKEQSCKKTRLQQGGPTGPGKECKFYFIYVLLFRSVLFSFYIFGDFQIYFCLMASNLIPFQITEHNLYNLNTFKFIKICFVVQNMTILCAYLKIMCFLVFFWCCLVASTVNVNQVRLIDTALVFHIFTAFLSICLTNYGEEVSGISNYNCIKFSL